jgi:M6 family metalloprotease-like protein
LTSRIARISIWLFVAGLSAVVAVPVLASRPAPPYRVAGKVTAVAAAPGAGSGLNVYQRARLQSLVAPLAPLSAQATGDTLRIAVFQVQFTDSLMGGQPGSNRPQLRDSTWFANELVHLEQYYRGASRQRFHVRWFLDGRLHTLSRRMTYYGADATEETRVVELAQEVIALSDDAVDFADFDHVFIIHAGAGQETDVAGDSPNQIWSSFYDRSDIRRALDDDTAAGLATGDTRGGAPFFVDNFSVVPSHASQDFVTVGTLGVWTYQIGSRIGLVPLFDSTPAGAPDSQGVGGFCLMGYGLFNVNGFVPAFPCAFNRALAGWVEPVVIDAGDTPVSFRVADINTAASADTVCVKVPVTENEYYLVVNRVHDANFDSLFTFTDNDNDLIPDNTDSLEGAEFDFFLTDLTNPAVRRYSEDYGFEVLYRHTGSGVYIWHVDERVIRDAVEQGFLPDDYAARKGVDLEEADGVQDLDRGGPAAFALGSYFDSFRAADGNHAVFGPATKPASVSNAGASTGIEISTTSSPGAYMRVTLRREIPYSDTRVRWNAASPGQPATPVDLDGDGSVEIVVLSDSAGVFVFNAAGAEWNDADNNPETVAPYIAVPGVEWTGPPVFANLDASPDIEIVAAAKRGALFAWKADGTELADGDANAGTTGVLYAGGAMLAPPMLLDVDGSASEVVVAEANGDLARVRLINTAGQVVTPALPNPGWPVDLEGQAVTPFAEARLLWDGTTTFGIVAATQDTTSGRANLYWIPVRYDGSVDRVVGGMVSAVLATGPEGDVAPVAPSAPATGDLDGDGDDEIVVALASGEVLVFELPTASSNALSRQSGALRAKRPSAPALGDADGDGALEIALWDEEYMYLLESNARVLLEWPRPIRLESAGEAPPSRARREFESPLFANLGGDDASDALFPLDDGTLAALTAAGGAIAGFPRVGPAEAGAAPSIATVTAGAWTLFAAGSGGPLSGVDAVIDSVAVDRQTALSIQSLPGGAAALEWPMARANLRRTGRVEASLPPLAAAAGAYDAGSFMIYPNPVAGGEVNARVLTSASATVHLSIYTIEGQEAVARTFTVNPNGLANTPFDETIDVHTLKSGVYLMRLRIESAAGSGSLVKTFAVRR